MIEQKTTRDGWRIGRMVAVVTLGVWVAAPAAAQGTPAWEDDLALSEETELVARPQPVIPSGERALTSLGAVALNIVVMPVRLIVGLLGAELGGVTGALTLGNEEAAAGIWNVTTDGSYTATPAAIEGREALAWGGRHP